MPLIGGSFVRLPRLGVLDALALIARERVADLSSFLPLHHDLLVRSHSFVDAGPRSPAGELLRGMPVAGEYRLSEPSTQEAVA